MGGDGDGQLVGFLGSGKEDGSGIGWVVTEKKRVEKKPLEDVCRTEDNQAAGSKL